MKAGTVTLALAACGAAASGQSFDFGLYSGQWENQTFLTSGAVSVLIEDLGAGQVGITADLDGGVFGMGDPDPVTVTGSVVGDVFTLNPLVGHPVFGDVSGGVDASGAAAFSLVDAAGGSFGLVTLGGTMLGGLIDLDYQIFTPNSPTVPFAVGRITAQIPGPGSLALAASAAVLWVRRRRG